MTGLVEAEPERYGEIQKYVTDIDPEDDAETIKTIFENLAFNEENYNGTYQSLMVKKRFITHI